MKIIPLKTSLGMHRILNLAEKCAETRKVIEDPNIYFVDFYAAVDTVNELERQISKEMSKLSTHERQQLTSLHGPLSKLNEAAT